MATVGCFEDLIAWQHARTLTSAIYRISRQGPLAKDFGLAGQLQRASVSIMSNIAEGFERGSAKEFHRFLSIAKASCAEVRSQLVVALDAGYLDQPQIDALSRQASEVARTVGGLRSAIGKHLDERPTS